MTRIITETKGYFFAAKSCMTCVNIRTQVGARRAAHELALRGLVQEIQFGLENFG